MRLYFLFCFSNLNQSIYIRLAEVSIGYALTTNDTKSGFYLYFFLFTPHGNFNVQKHTYTKQEQCKEKKQTNKQITPPPPPAKKQNKTFSCFVWIYYRVQRFHSDFLFEEKKRGIWLSSMTHTVTQGATPVRWGADKHVTKLTGVTGQLV